MLVREAATLDCTREVPMFKRKLTTIVAVSAVSGVVLTAGVACLVIRHRRKRRKKQFLSKKKRAAITEVIELAADEVMPNGVVASSLLHHHLSTLSDKKLLVLYAATKVGEYMREAGIDPLQASAEQLELVKSRFSEAQSEETGDREALLGFLLSHNFEELKPLLIETLSVL